MATKDVGEALVRFLGSKEAQAIALSGNWGRGKTFYWRRVVTEHAAAGKLAGKYSYVSLFGLTSLAELKQSLFDNAVDADRVVEGASSETWLLNAASAVQAGKSAASPRLLDRFKPTAKKAADTGRKHFSVVEAIPIVRDFAPMIRAAAFLSVRDYVICLDDLERRGAGLPLKEVLGLVSFLTEQRNCRVIVILNEDALEAEDKSEFATLREKVFDSDIKFVPTPSECAALAFPTDWEHGALATQYSEKLGITNIRILQRIRRTVNAFQPHLAGRDVSLARQLVHSATLLTWVFNSKEDGTPRYDFVKGLGYGDWFDLMGDKKDRPQHEKDWQQLLSDYGYRSTDAVDAEVCKYLENGFVVADALKDVLDRAHEEAIKAQASGAFEDAWDLYHDTFADNTEELVRTMEQRFMDGAQWISVGNADSTIRLLRELGHGAVAEKLMAHWIDTNAKLNPDALNLEENPFARDMKDEAFRKAVEAHFFTQRERPALGDIIKRVAVHDSWGSTDEETLEAATVEAYVEFFKGVGPDDKLSSYVKGCLRFGQFANATDRQKAIANKVKQALELIGKESTLNAIRVRRYGVEVKEK